LQLVPDPDSAKKNLKLLWLACGKRDNLIRISQGVHAYLKEKGVSHVWHVDGNAHDAAEWRNNLMASAFGDSPGVPCSGGSRRERAGCQRTIRHLWSRSIRRAVWLKFLSSVALGEQGMASSNWRLASLTPPRQLSAAVVSAFTSSCSDA
jgi:hypothetical protein